MDAAPLPPLAGGGQEGGSPALHMPTSALARSERPGSDGLAGNHPHPSPPPPAGEGGSAA